MRKAASGRMAGNDLNVKAVVGGNLLVPLKAVGGVVGSADHADVGLLDQVAAGETGLGELGVGKVPDLLGSLAVEDALVAEVALKLQVAPLKDGVANAATQGLGPLWNFSRAGASPVIKRSSTPLARIRRHL